MSQLSRDSSHVCMFSQDVQDFSFHSFLHKTIQFPEGGICFKTTCHRHGLNPKAKNIRFITCSHCHSIFMISHVERSSMSDHLQIKKHKAHSKTSYSIMKFSSLFKEISVRENELKCAAGKDTFAGNFLFSNSLLKLICHMLD